EEVLEQKERSGPTMVMAHLQGKHTRDTTQDVADQWHEALVLGGLQPEVFVVEAGQVL
ncbi:unnamed protein product, partial [Symbiodinium sp. KB8]